MLFTGQLCMGQVISCGFASPKLTRWIHVESHVAKLAWYRATTFMCRLSSPRYPPFSLRIRSENQLDPSEQHLTDLRGCWNRVICNVSRCGFRMCLPVLAAVPR